MESDDTCSISKTDHVTLISDVYTWKLGTYVRTQVRNNLRTISLLLLVTSISFLLDLLYFCALTIIM